jgi:acyl carrier protein
VSIDREVLQARVVAIVAEALDVEPSTVKPYSSLIDDLGAESIDFLDVVFRLETAFSIRIPEDEIWKGSLGSLDPDDSAGMMDAIARLRERMPEFRWDRLPAQLTRQDLPRLITIQTIVDYLYTHLPDAAAGRWAM